MATCENYRMNQAKFSENEEEKGVGGNDGSKKKEKNSNKNDEKMVKEKWITRTMGMGIYVDDLGIVH
ncbi:hypothetical protein L6452_35673 [Arctium lappa]|uniref:Uncharacterized protein n=1 Tax=Arctium lappa TaxID=4217 RepID=A0ACB8Y7R1_ARCLA|nr:hypothetical protein L6452_35673 [Arctium lappa]